MKRQLLVICTILLISNMLKAQPQWKFPIAFEDATGAKDTIWCIWDSTATDGQLNSVDTALGEAGVTFDYSKFNVWIYNNVPNADSTKTIAIPFYESFGLYVYAFNYQYPITVSWDSSMFHAPGLPYPVGYVDRAIIDNDYFFLVNNDPPEQKFNMLLDNNVVAPWFNWGAQSQFPMDIGIMNGFTVGIRENIVTRNDRDIFPNPVNQSININTELEFTTYSILSNEGKFIVKDVLLPKIENGYTIHTTEINPGFYHLILTNKKNEMCHEKIIIIH